MGEIKKLVFQFGDMSMTLTEIDLESVLKKLEAQGRTPSGKDFADACMEHMKAHARPTRTVLHN